MYMCMCACMYTEFVRSTWVGVTQRGQSTVAAACMSVGVDIEGNKKVDRTYMAVMLHLCEDLCDFELVILMKLSPDMFGCLLNVQLRIKKWTSRNQLF